MVFSVNTFFGSSSQNRSYHYYPFAMKQILLNLFFLFSIIAPLKAQTEFQTQLEMNIAAGSVYAKADEELNIVYQKILKEYTHDHVFLDALKASQNNWITFRDSELKMKYPPRNSHHYGSIHSVCVSNYMTKLTIDRTQTLREWIDKTEEGDVCAGSVKIKPPSGSLGLEITSSVNLDHAQLGSFLMHMKEPAFYKTDNLILSVFIYTTTPDDGDIPNETASYNMVIALTEIGDSPRQNTHMIRNLQNPDLIGFDRADHKAPILRISHQQGQAELELWIQCTIDECLLK